MAKVECCCLWCKQKFTARTADRKRGWALYCSKSCKAMDQEKRTGQYTEYQARQDDNWAHPLDHDGHGQW